MLSLCLQPLCWQLIVPHPEPLYHSHGRPLLLVSPPMQRHGRWCPGCSQSAGCPAPLAPPGPPHWRVLSRRPGALYPQLTSCHLGYANMLSRRPAKKAAGIAIAVCAHCARDSPGLHGWSKAAIHSACNWQVDIDLFSSKLSKLPQHVPNILVTCNCPTGACNQVSQTGAIFSRRCSIAVLHCRNSAGNLTNTTCW